MLLTPCIDYVIVFLGLAGGDEERPLAVAPLLMLAQMLLLPVYLWAFVGVGLISSIEFAPFVEAFLFIIAVLPLVLALPTAFDFAPLAVVTQALVELVAVVVFVRLVPSRAA